MRISHVRSLVGLLVFLSFVAVLVLVPVADAQRGGRGGGGRGGGGMRGGGGGMRGGGGARTSVGRGFSGGGSRDIGRGAGSRPQFDRPAAGTRPSGDFGANRPDRGAANRPSQRPSGEARRDGDRGINRDANRNRDVNRNTNRDINRDWQGDWDLDIDVDDGWHPWGAAAAFTAGAVLTAATIGSVAYTLPAGCSVAVVNTISYQHCGTVWYEPQFVGTSVQYIVVEEP